MAGLQDIKADLERQLEMQKIMTRNAMIERDYDSDNSSEARRKKLKNKIQTNNEENNQ